MLEVGDAPGRSNITTTSIPGTTTSLVVGDVPTGIFYVRIRARSLIGLSGPSQERIVTVGTTAAPPGTPGGLTATVDGTTLELAWEAPMSGGAPTTYVIAASQVAGQTTIGSFTTGNTATGWQVRGGAAWDLLRSDPRAECLRPERTNSRCVLRRRSGRTAGSTLQSLGLRQRHVAPLDVDAWARKRTDRLPA